jgi:hypothetical protein
MKTAPHTAIAVGSSVLTAFTILLMGQQLPQTVASHFNAAGVPDSFMPRAEFITLMLVFCSGLPLAVWGLQVAVLRGGRPKIPRADHWLSAPHREQTLEWLSLHAAIGSAGLCAFLTHTFWLTVRAHQESPIALPQVPFWSSLVVFMAATVAWVIWQQRQFR